MAVLSTNNHQNKSLSIVREGNAMQGLGQDLRYAIRMLMKNQGYAAMAILLLAIGIGANTTVFSVLDCLLLRPMPVAEPSHLANIYSKRQGQWQVFSYPEYEQILHQSKSFSSILASARHTATFYQNGDSETMRADWVSENYFSVLGIHPVIGQDFVAMEKSNPGDTQQVIISYGLWQRRFGSDPAIAGKIININRKSAVVRGVAPPSFGGLERGMMITDLWLPVHSWAGGTVAGRKFKDFDLLGRIRPGMKIEAVRSELGAIAHGLAQANPDTNQGTTYLAMMMEEKFFTSLVRGALIMSGPFLILMICCANVAGISLARGEARRNEIAMRLALGSGIGRVLRQLLTESFMLVVPGTALGLLLTHWLLSLQSAFMMPMDSLMRLDLRVDWRVLSFALAASVISVAVAGLTPALRAVKVELFEVLKGATGRTEKGNFRFGLRNALIAGQIMFSLVLLIAGGLFIKSLLLSKQVDPGFDSKKKILIIETVASMPGQDSDQKFFLPAIEQIKAIPGVKGITYAASVPLSGIGGGASFEVSIPGIENPPGQKGFIIKHNSVGRDYFRTMGASLVRGRDFSHVERSPDQRAIIINETMAKRFWPDADPIGRYINVNDRSFQITGIVRNGKINHISEDSEPYIYFSFSQFPRSEASIIIETSGPPLDLAAAVKNKIRSIDKSVEFIGIKTLKNIMETSLYVEHTIAVVSGALGVLGILITSVGLYGILSYIARRRTREIGIRIALGAQSGDISRLVIGKGFSIAAGGIAGGLLISFFAMRLVSRALYGVAPTDIWIYLLGSLIILGITLLASYIPARRAAKTDPISALRCD
jgi:putative ABC transport system permease protein